MGNEGEKALFHRVATLLYSIVKSSKTMKRLGTLLLYAALLLTGAASAHAQAREDMSDEQVESTCQSMFQTDPLAVSIGPTKINMSFHKLSSDEITKFANLHGNPTKGAIGVTKYVPDYTVKTYRNKLKVQVGGRWCWRDEIHVEMARQPVEVYVSNDYFNNICIQQAIYKHEMAHVSVFHTFLKYLATTLQEKHSSVIGKVNSSRFKPSDIPQDYPQEVSAIQSQISAAIPKISEINDEYDSPSEYNRLWHEMAACTPSILRNPLPAHVVIPLPDEPAAPAPKAVEVAAAPVKAPIQVPVQIQTQASVPQQVQARPMPPAAPPPPPTPASARASTPKAKRVALF